jgi:DeoR-like helix-turn-helix domain
MDKRQTEDDKYIANRFNEYKEFIKDKHVSFVIKKSERIVYGVYMLSRFVPASDSLCFDLKKTAHNLLEAVSKFVSTTGSTQQDVDNAQALLQYMSSLLSLAFISGYISSSNIEIMKNEINYLHKHIEELSTTSARETRQLHLKSDLFVVNQSKPREHESTHRDEMSFRKKVESKPREDLSFKEKYKKFKEISEKPIKDIAPVESKDEREKRIIDVIRDKGVVSIKDISSVIFDVSEKTIQRTLQLLIDKGQIKKEGERRWAKYQLV